MSAVSFDHGFYIIQSDPGPFHVMKIPGWNAIELLENMLLGFCGDSNTIVAEFNHKTVFTYFGRDSDSRFGCGIFLSVIDKVVNDIGEVDRIDKQL
jgi:hypothetical protein